MTYFEARGMMEPFVIRISSFVIPEFCESLE